MPPRLISDIIVGTPPILIIAFSHLTSTVVRAPISICVFRYVCSQASLLMLFHFSSQIWIVISIDGPDLFHVRSSFVRFLICH
jgi:hypothetical protein